MANYDQSGNPVSGAQRGGQQQQAGQTGGQQGGGWQGGQGQQSQYTGGTQQQGTQGQGASGRTMQQTSGRGTTPWSGGLAQDLHSGFGAGPFQLISRLSDEMDRIFEGFGFGPAWPRAAGQGAQSGRAAGQGLRTLWAPHIEVCERNGKLLIQADLPGVRKEDVDLRIEDDAVIIQGQRQQQNERNEGGFYHSERSYGSFYRMIPLPEGVDVEQANATFRDGVLQIELPAPQQRQRGRRLEIRDGSSGQAQVGGPAGSAQSSSPSGQQQAEGSSERR